MLIFDDAYAAYIIFHTCSNLTFAG